MEDCTNNLEIEVIQGNGDFVDIGAFMAHVNYIKEKLWPLASLGKELVKIRRWENYPVSIMIVTILSVSALLPSVVLALICAAVLLLILAGNRHIPKSKYRQHQIQPDVIPRLINEDKESLKAVASAQKSRKKALNDFRQLLKLSDNILMLIGVLLDQIKRVSVSLLLTIIALMWVPVSAIVSLIIVILFCWNDHFFCQTKRVMRITKPTPSSRNFPTQRGVYYNRQRDDQGRTPSPPLPTDGSTQVELSNSGDSIVGGGATQTNGSPSKRDKGVCHKCGSAFNIIKRKYSCSNCGYFYCSSCTAKVSKTILGATSPAAFQETVRVCLECKSELSDSQTVSNNLVSSISSLASSTTTA